MIKVRGKNKSGKELWIQGRVDTQSVFTDSEVIGIYQRSATGQHKAGDREHEATYEAHCLGEGILMRSPRKTFFPGHSQRGPSGSCMVGTGQPGTRAPGGCL